MHIVKLEALYLGAVRERRVWRRKAFGSSPYRATAGSLKRTERLAQDPAPFEMRAIERAAECVKDQELEALANLDRDHVIGEARDECGKPTRIGIGGR